MNNNRAKGETLVETVVAFGVLMVMLAMLATALKGAAQINRRAAERAAQLDADCTLVEQNMGLFDQTGTIADTLILTPSGGDLANGQITIPLEVRRGELLYYFGAAAPGGN